MYAIRIFAAALLLLAAGSARAQLDKPALIIASPAAQGVYAGAVMVVVPAQQGHIGFLLNGPAPITVGAAFPDEPAMAKLVNPIWLGGPLATDSMYAMVRHDPGEGALRLFGDVFVALSGESVDRVALEWPGEARFFAGFAAWPAGELAEQVRDGDWLVTEPEALQVFSAQPGELWPELIKKVKGAL
jgi:putative transcriptional regulator